MDLRFDPFTDPSSADPYPLYRRLRDESPLFVARARETDLYCVSRHEDVLRVLRDAETFSSAAMQDILMNADMGPFRLKYVAMLIRFLVRSRINPFRLPRTGSLVSIDPPRHDQLRSIVARGFTPRRIAAWETRAEEIVERQLGGLPSRARFDVLNELAIPLPTTLIAEMIGVAPERRDDFKRWSDAIIAISSGTAKENPIESGLLDHFGDLYGYLRGVVRERRRTPTDDLVSVLVDPSQKDVLDEFDVIQFIVLLLVAGNETTTNLIGNAVDALLDRPDQVDLVARDPKLIPGLIEEALRFDSPVQTLFRTATEAVDIAGTSVPKGAVVCVLLGSANRDERRFPEPDTFDVKRDATGHVAFGFGVHFCLGASLARLEARTAFAGLLPQLARFERAGERGELIDSFVVRGRRQLELRAA